MRDARVLVTGGTGCIGAVAVRDLLRAGVGRVVVVTSSGAPGQLPLWLGDELDARVRLVRQPLGEPGSAGALEALLRAEQPTRVVHLGALQSPDCDAGPMHGMQVNVGGTLDLLAAVEAAGGVQRLVFASSAAVYGPRSLYPGPSVPEDAALAPPNLYGVWKVAGEHLARLFARHTGVATVCLRLNTTYGKGRDRGKTSAVTTAMKHVALGHLRGRASPFRMPYNGRENYHYVEDVGAHFAQCALQPFDGFAAFNVKGRTIEVAEFVERIAANARALGLGDHVDLGIAGDATPNLFVSDLDDSAIGRSFRDLPRTELDDGIGRTLRDFVELARGGRLAVG